MAKKGARQNHKEYLIARAIDDKSSIDDINAQIRPILAQALREGWDAKRLMEHPKVALLLAARAVTIGVTEADSAKALSAIKDIQDRTQGKPTEKRETTHKLASLPDEQLDAKLKSLLTEDEDDSSDEESQRH